VQGLLVKGGIVVVGGEWLPTRGITAAIVGVVLLAGGSGPATCGG
jgi:hypothetical protein